MRRDFMLPEDDTAYLDGLPISWETVRDGSMWLLAHNWTIPAGYNVECVSVALLIPGNYPEDQIDMFYFKPHLARLDSQPIGALCSQAIQGESWQRWSRHRTPANPWRPGIDNVASHLSLMDLLLRREFDLRPVQ